jgi:hypothetical protein
MVLPFLDEDSGHPAWRLLWELIIRKVHLALVDADHTSRRCNAWPVLASGRTLEERLCTLNRKKFVEANGLLLLVTDLDV